MIVSALAIAGGLFILMAAVSHVFHRPSANESHASGEVPVPDAGISPTAQTDPPGTRLAATQNSAPPAKPGDTPAQSPGEIESTAALSNATAAREKFSAVQQISELADVIDGDRPKDEKLGVALATLETSDKKVRAAALEAVRELDDRDAVPQLQELAAQTDDPAEKAALLDVADFLNLPSFMDHTAGNQASGRIIPKTSTKLSERAALLQQARQNRQVGGGQTPAGQP